MRVLITGICGYVGSNIARHLVTAIPYVEIYGIDNLSRSGAETSVKPLRDLGVSLYRGDVRLRSDLAMIPDVDWVIDCAANPSVTAGAHSNKTDSSRQLIEHNLLGTVNLLEFCRERYAGLVLLSSSRVYSVNALRRIPLREGETRFEPVHPEKSGIPGYSQFGISEDFPTTAPVSLYGATKLASETLALEYAHTFNFPVWIDRCGVIGGPGQFGKVDQGILSFWVYSFLLNRPLKYIGFDGSGKQVRDFVRAEDVASLIAQQILDPARSDRRIFNVGGGNANAFSLLELSEICRSFFHLDMNVASSLEERVFDIPYYVTDIRRVEEHWDWSPLVRGRSVVTQVCEWADAHRDFVASLARGSFSFCNEADV